MKSRRTISARLRAGFSLLEVTLACTLLGAFVGSTVVVLLAGTRGAATVMAGIDLEGTARRTLDRIASELAGAGPNVLVPDPTAPFGSASLTFQRVDGIDENHAVIWGAPVQLALRRENGERDDDIDNDGDGLVDEHELVWTLDPGGPEEHSVVWVHGVREYLQGEEANGRDDNENGLVDERGLSLVREGGRLTVRLTLLGPAAEHGELVRTVQTSVRLHN